MQKTLKFAIKKDIFHDFFFLNQVMSSLYSKENILRGNGFTKQGRCSSLLAMISSRNLVSLPSDFTAHSGDFQEKNKNTLSGGTCTYQICIAFHFLIRKMLTIWSIFAI